MKGYSIQSLHFEYKKKGNITGYHSEFDWSSAAINHCPIKIVVLSRQQTVRGDLRTNSILWYDWSVDSTPLISNTNLTTARIVAFSLGRFFQVCVPFLTVFLFSMKTCYFRILRCCSSIRNQLLKIDFNLESLLSQPTINEIDFFPLLHVFWLSVNSNRTTVPIFRFLETFI